MCVLKQMWSSQCSLVMNQSVCYNGKSIGSSDESRRRDINSGQVEKDAERRGQWCYSAIMSEWRNDITIINGYWLLICWALAAFSVSWSYTQLVGLLGWGISPSQGLYLHIEQHKHRINAHNTDIHALSGIQTHNPSVQMSEDSSCLRLRDHCDQQMATQ
jgi:hypothetical protein